jgi:hypothetical protein
LLALLNAFDINTLMLLDMEISQKICKIVPYHTATDNKKIYSEIETDPEGDDDELQSQGLPKGKKFESLFYNLAARDKHIWRKINVMKLIYHKPSKVMFIFSNQEQGKDILKLLKKIY